MMIDAFSGYTFQDSGQSMSFNMKRHILILAILKTFVFPKKLSNTSILSNLIYMLFKFQATDTKLFSPKN